MSKRKQLYAVDARNMHTGVHELFVANTELSAKMVESFLLALDDADELEQLDLWDEIDEIVLDSFEINFRYITPALEYFRNDTDYLIVNSCSVDYY